MELVALAIFLCGVVVGASVLRAAQIIALALEQPEPKPMAIPPTASVSYPEQRRRPVSAPQRVS